MYRGLSGASGLVVVRYARVRVGSSVRVGIFGGCLKVYGCSIGVWSVWRRNSGGGLAGGALTDMAGCVLLWIVLIWEALCGGGSWSVGGSIVGAGVLGVGCWVTSWCCCGGSGKASSSWMGGSSLIRASRCVISPCSCWTEWSDLSGGAGLAVACTSCRCWDWLVVSVGVCGPPPGDYPSVTRRSG